MNYKVGEREREIFFYFIIKIKYTLASFDDLMPDDDDDGNSRSSIYFIFPFLVVEYNFRF